MMMKRKKNYLEPQSILQPIEWTSSLLAGTGTGHNVGFTPGVSDYGDRGTEEIAGASHDPSNPSHPAS